MRIKEPEESVSEMVSSSSSLPSGSGTRETFDPLRAFEREREMEGDDDEVMGCREAVEILTRNPKKGVFLSIIHLPRSRVPSPYIYSSKHAITNTPLTHSVLRCDERRSQSSRTHVYKERLPPR